MRVIVVSHSAADHLGGAEQSLLALLDHWTAADPAVEPIVVAIREAACRDSRTYTSYTSLDHLPHSRIAAGVTPAANAADAPPMRSE